MILLMFGVGIHFSVADLLAVRRIAVPGAVVQICMATLLGLLMTQLWGWPLGAGLVFGLCLSVASTVVLLRAMASRGMLDSTDGRIAVEWLVVEDLATVVVLVLVVNGSSLSHEAAADALPLQDAFSVLFFVAVGMLFEPRILIEAPLAVLMVVLIVMIGTSIGAFAIVLAFRYPVRTALTISASLARIGEFSFILAALSATLGLHPPEGQSLIVAGAILEARPRLLAPDVTICATSSVDALVAAQCL